MYFAAIHISYHPRIPLPKTATMLILPYFGPVASPPDCNREGYRVWQVIGGAIETTEQAIFYPQRSPP